MGELDFVEPSAALRALFQSSQAYVVYRLKRVPLEQNPLGGTVEVVSPSIRTILGVRDPEDLTTWFAAVHPEDVPRAMQSQLRCYHEHVPFDEILRIEIDGEQRWIHAISHPVLDAHGTTTHYNGLIVDVTDRMRLETEAEELRELLVKSQRLEAVGGLAASVAHDFNNLLQAILTTATLAHLQRESPEQVAALLTDLTGLIERGATLTRDLVSYSRGSTGRAWTEDMWATIERVARMTDRLFVDVEVGLGAAPGRIGAAIEPGQLEQVLLNLCLNAAQANASTIHLSVEALSSREATALVGQPVSDEMVCVRVRDDGGGIPQAQLAQIFQPFFTTRGEEGTGLGLASTLRIVQAAAGMIHVESREGEGATFHLLIPREHRKVRAPAAEPRPLKRGARVLLADDDDRILAAMSKYLDKLGYDVTPAATYVEAISHWEGCSGNYQLIITDTVMKGRGGLELVRHVRKTHPGLPLIVMSGNPDDAAIQEMLAWGSCAFLSKPFSMSTLQETIAGLAHPTDDDHSAS